MKILQIASPWMNTPPKNYGGTEWVIANLVKGLTCLGNDVTLFATKDSESGGKLQYIFEKPLTVLGIPWNAALPALIHYFEAFKNASDYDIVHVHLASQTDLLALPFLANLSELGIANVLTIHSHWPYDRYSNTDKIFLNLYADKILAVNISSFMQKTLPEQFKDGGFVYNSLDTSRMKFQPRPGSYLTWLGKIIPEKGTAEAIKIAKLAGEKLIFAGIVDKQHLKSMDYFFNQVKLLIDGKQIQYLGPADLKLKNKLLGGAKAFINPIAWDEPFGMVLVESMACGTPVISYNKGAVSEVVHDKKTGFLVKNREEMIRALKKIDKISRWDCRKHVEQNFSPEQAAEEYLYVYRKEMQLLQSQKADTSLEFIPSTPLSNAVLGQTPLHNGHSNGTRLTDPQFPLISD